VSVTSAPGITAPFLSRTVPVIVEFAWACPVKQAISKTSGNRNSLYFAVDTKFNFMRLPPVGVGCTFIHSGAMVDCRGDTRIALCEPRHCSNAKTVLDKLPI
jgi:hypothetical protein